MSNPFFYGGRIIDPTHFFGRERELRRLFAGLETASNGQVQHFSIVGPRRIGKSSLIYHITQVYQYHLSQPENYKFVYVDLDDPHCQKLTGLLHHILQKLDFNHPANPSLENFIENLETFKQTQNKIPVLCIDEFEHLTKRKTEFPDSVFEAWRSMGNSGQLVFITSSKVTLDELIQQGNLTSQFHNIFTLLPLGEFTQEGQQAFMSIGENCDKPFTKSECEIIKSLAGFHPAKLQVVCGLLYEAKLSGDVDWRKIEQEYNNQINFIFGKSNRKMPTPLWVKNIFNFIFVNIPKAIGRFFLDIFNRDKAQESTAILAGWIILIVIVAALIGYINLQKVIDLFKDVWLFFFPLKN